MINLNNWYHLSCLTLLQSRALGRFALTPLFSPFEEFRLSSTLKLRLCMYLVLLSPSPLLPILNLCPWNDWLGWHPWGSTSEAKGPPSSTLFMLAGLFELLGRLFCYLRPGECARFRYRFKMYYCWAPFLHFNCDHMASPHGWLDARNVRYETGTAMIVAEF